MPDGPVLVVGVSHSGSDLAFELAASRRTYLSGKSHGQLPVPIDSRRGRLVWPGVRDGMPLLDDGHVLDVASIVWCTGYRPDYGWIDLPVIDEDGWPVIERGAAVAAPGLWFLGVPFLSGITSMLVLGAGRDAEMVVRQVAARVGQPAVRGRGPDDIALTTSAGRD